MNYVGILASGSGTRMGKTELPKQFLKIGTKPIIIHTLEQFYINQDVDKIVVAVSKNWIEFTKDLINEYIKTDDIEVIEGGNSRTDSIINICEYIKEKYNPNDEDIIITHDAVRPFINQRIINDNIKKCIKYGATDTVIPAIDTIVESKDESIISNIPIRSNMYQGQTPQSFRLNELLNVYKSMTKEEKNILTDACKVYVLKNKTVKLVEGENSNFKITNIYDLKIANLIVESGENKNA